MELTNGRDWSCFLSVLFICVNAFFLTNRILSQQMHTRSDRMRYFLCYTMVYKGNGACVEKGCFGKRCSKGIDSFLVVHDTHPCKYCYDKTTEINPYSCLHSDCNLSVQRNLQKQTFAQRTHDYGSSESNGTLAHQQKWNQTKRQTCASVCQNAHWTQIEVQPNGNERNSQLQNWTFI